MPPTENIYLDESLSSNGDVQRQSSLQEENALGVNASTQWESHRKRACALGGSAIIQLPIWGTLSPSL